MLDGSGGSVCVGNSIFAFISPMAIFEASLALDSSGFITRTFGHSIVFGKKTHFFQRNSNYFFVLRRSGIPKLNFTQRPKKKIFGIKFWIDLMSKL